MSHHDRDPMDNAIDRVAARLVSVEYDEAMVECITARLPDRSTGSRWFSGLMLQAGAAAIVAMLGFAWATRDRGEAVRDAAQVASVADVGPEAPRVVPSPDAAMATPDRSVAAQPAAHPTLTVLAESPDHERSLMPVPALMALEVSALEAPSLPDEAPVVVAPIVLTELPLSGESSSPR